MWDVKVPPFAPLLPSDIPSPSLSHHNASFPLKTSTNMCFYLQNVVLLHAYPTRLSVQRTEFARHLQLACRHAGSAPRPMHSTRPAPWRRQSRGFGTPFSISSELQQSNSRSSFLCHLPANELHVPFPQGKGMQHTGVTGGSAVPGLGQTRRRQLSARRDLAPRVLHKPLCWSRVRVSSAPRQRRRGCRAPPSPCPARQAVTPQGSSSPVPTPAPGTAWWAFTSLYTLSSFLFTI